MSAQRSPAETLRELDRQRDAIAQRAAALRQRLGRINPLLWLGGGVLAGALAGRLLPRRGAVRALAPLAALFAAAEAWLLGMLEPRLARWRERSHAGHSPSETRAPPSEAASATTEADGDRTDP